MLDRPDRPRRRKLLTLLAALVVTGLLIAAWPRVKHLIAFDAVDACLDHGGCWDAQRARCEDRDQERCRPSP